MGANPTPVGEQGEGASGPWSLKGRHILVVEDQSLIAMEIQSISNVFRRGIKTPLAG